MCLWDKHSPHLRYFLPLLTDRYLCIFYCPLNMIRSSQKPTCLTHQVANEGINTWQNAEPSSNSFCSFWYLFPEHWMVSYTPNHIYFHFLHLLSSYICLLLHIRWQSGVFSGSNFNFIFYAANCSDCFLLAIYRAICLQLWLGETLQFFFPLLLSAPSYISELKVSVCITTCIPFALRHSIFAVENSRWKVTRLLWLP